MFSGFKIYRFIKRKLIFIKKIKRNKNKFRLFWIICFFTVNRFSRYLFLILVQDFLIRMIREIYPDCIIYMTIVYAIEYIYMVFSGLYFHRTPLYLLYLNIIFQCCKWRSLSDTCWYNLPFWVFQKIKYMAG